MLLFQKRANNERIYHSTNRQCTSAGILARIELSGPSKSGVAPYDDDLFTRIVTVYVCRICILFKHSMQATITILTVLLFRKLLSGAFTKRPMSLLAAKNPPV